jgi:hypothetical protein
MERAQRTPGPSPREAARVKPRKSRRQWNSLMLIPNEQELLLQAARIVPDHHQAGFFAEIAQLVRRGADLPAAIDAALKLYRKPT